MFRLTHSPVTHHTFQHVEFYLKRDDLLHPEFSGNKARKFAYWLSAPLEHVDTLIGYGSPQANSLYSMAALAKLRGWCFDYYVTRIPSWLQANPIGNFQAAVNLSANIIPVQLDEHENLQTWFEKQKFGATSLCLPEGGRIKEAELGVKQLASEIIEFREQQGFDSLNVFLPSGTGTTALYLHKYLQPQRIQVFTCSCVGDDDYLQQQFTDLGESSFPSILSVDKKRHFGKTYRENFTVWQQLREQTGIEFDLLYDPIMWHCLLNEEQFAAIQKSYPYPNLYIHQGGLKGNESMLSRYRRKYPLLFN